MDKHRFSRSLLSLFIATLFLFGCNAPSADLAIDSSMPIAESIAQSQPATTKSKTLSKTNSQAASSSASKSVTSSATAPITQSATIALTQSTTIPITQPATVASTTPVITKSSTSTQANKSTSTEKKSNSASTKSSLSDKSSSSSYKTLSSSGNLEVHFLDVGQGDSILIKLPNKQTMLIDAGEASRGTGVINYR